MRFSEKNQALFSVSNFIVFMVRKPENLMCTTFHSGENDESYFDFIFGKGAFNKYVTLGEYLIRLKILISTPVKV